MEVFNMKGVYLQLNEEMISQLDQRAEERGVPRASIIKQLLHEGLKSE